jgi:hypothetical protein
MTRSALIVTALVILATAVGPTAAHAQTATALPTPLGLADVVRIARERRAELLAARAQVRAGEARPAIVSSSASRCPGFVNIGGHRRWPISNVSAPTRIARLST